MAMKGLGTVGLAVVALAVALPGVMADLSLAPLPSQIPPALDRFLAQVRDATPSTARVLVDGEPPGLVAYRAAYLLYPRTVLSAAATDYAHASVALPLSWSALAGIARRDHARYVVLWSFPLQSQRTSCRKLCLQSGNGLAVELEP